MLLDIARAHSKQSGHSELWLTTYAHLAWNKPYYQRRGSSVAPKLRCSAELRALLEEQSAVLPAPTEPHRDAARAKLTSMKTCEYAGAPFEEARSHPWTDATGNPDFRYYDLTAAPEHIRTSLEDFVLWSHYAAIEGFYQLLDSLNRERSRFVSNDCAFTGPERNDHPAIEKAFQCSGRVMLLY